LNKLISIYESTILFALSCFRQPVRCQAKFLTSSAILCDKPSEISGLFLHVSYFASQSKGINFGDEVFDVCLEIKTFGKTSDSTQ